MSILIAGPDAALYRLAAPLQRASLLVDRCETREEALHLLAQPSRQYEIAFLCSTWQSAQFGDVRAAVNAHGACLVFAQLAQPDAPSATRPEQLDAVGDANIDLAPHDVERWRNVLTFAKRNPDDYPALRDALGTGTNLFAYHAPVKRSA